MNPNKWGWARRLASRDPTADVSAFIPTLQDCIRLQERLERILIENILPFWYPRTLDRENGGFLLNHDGAGKWLGPEDKTLISQARMTWFFARLARSPYGKPDHLYAAEHGLRFLADRLWDHENGGFFWSVKPDGTTPTLAEKHLVAQAYGLLALVELAAASATPIAETLATELFDLIESRAHDSENAGYGDCFAPDWSLLPAGYENAMRTPTGVKTYLTHIHIMEAITGYYTLRPNILAATRIQELLIAQTMRFADAQTGEGINWFRQDWKPLSDGRVIEPFYDHDLKAISVIHRACHVLGLPVTLLRPFLERVFDTAVHAGFDRRRGGFYQPPQRAARPKDKEWWSQAEALTAALHMFGLTRREAHWSVFIRTLDWIETEQIDWKVGEWHAVVSADGRARGPKAWAWKAAFHNGRAMLDGIELLGKLRDGIEFEA